MVRSLKSCFLSPFYLTSVIVRHDSLQEPLPIYPTLVLMHCGAGSVWCIVWNIVHLVLLLCNPFCFVLCSVLCGTLCSVLCSVLCCALCCGFSIALCVALCLALCMWLFPVLCGVVHCVLYYVMCVWCMEAMHPYASWAFSWILLRAGGG